MKIPGTTYVILKTTMKMDVLKKSLMKKGMGTRKRTKNSKEEMGTLGLEKEVLLKISF